MKKPFEEAKEIKTREEKIIKSREEVVKDTIDQIMASFSDLLELTRKFNDTLLFNLKKIVAERPENEIIEFIINDDKLSDKEKKSFINDYRENTLSQEQLICISPGILEKMYRLGEMDLEDFKRITGLKLLEEPSLDKETSVLTQKLFSHMSDQLKELLDEKGPDSTDNEIVEAYMNIMHRANLIAAEFIRNEIHNQINQSSGIKAQNKELTTQDYVNKPDLFIALLTKPGKIVFDLKEEDFKDEVAVKIIRDMIKKGSSEVEVTTQLQVHRNFDPQELNEYLSIPVYETGNRIVGKLLDAKDKRVHNAVITLIDNAMKLNPHKSYADNCGIVITLNQIHKAMGYKRNPTREQKAGIIRSMYKLGNNFIWMNNSQEYDARGIDMQEAFDLYGQCASFGDRAYRLINADYTVDIRTKHSKADNLEDGFIINQIPPLLVHGKLTRQISSIPRDWLDLKGFRESEQIKALKYEIAQRIARAHYFKENGQGKRYNSQNYNTMVFEELFKEAGINADGKKTRYKYIGIVEKLLEAFKTQKGIIQKYQINYKKDAMYSVKFFV